MEINKKLIVVLPQYIVLESALKKSINIQSSLCHLHKLEHFSDPLASGPIRPTHQGIRKMPYNTSTVPQVCALETILGIV